MARAQVTMSLDARSRRELARIGKGSVNKELRAALVESTSGAVPAVRAKIRSYPSQKGKRKRDSLRSQIAMAIKRRIKATSRGSFVAIVSEPSGGLANLACAVEGEIPWQHPTFGHEPTVDQNPMPFFYETLEKIIPGIEFRVRQALIRFETKI